MRIPRITIGLGFDSPTRIPPARYWFVAGEIRLVPRLCFSITLLGFVLYAGYYWGA